MQKKQRTQPYVNEIPSRFINEIKAKGYKVIGFDVFLISLVADPGERPAPLPPDFKTKRGPKGWKNVFGDRALLIWRSGSATVP